ncbi:MAG: S9 family peptidase [Pseudomonadales bacterium]
MHRKGVSAALATALAGLLCAHPAAAAGNAPGNVPETTSTGARFTDLDVFNLEWANDPQVAPDGKRIAYVRQGFDVMNDRRVGRIWLIDPDGGNHKPLTDRQGTSPRWSPDGKRIAFLSGTDEGTEIYMHWLADNRTARISQLPESPGRLTWSPDGRWLAMTLFTPAQAAPMVKMPKAPEGARWAPAAKVIESLHYRADGRGYLREGFTHVYVMPAEGGTPRQVTSGNFNHDRGIAWSRDGSALYLSANRRDDWELKGNDTELYRLDLDSGELTQLTNRYGPDNAPLLSPDGRFLAYTGYDDRGLGYHVTQLSVLDLERGGSRVLTADLDRSVDDVVWDDASRGLYFSYTDQGEGRIAYAPLHGQRRAVVDGLGGTSMSRPYSGGALHAAAGTLAYTFSTPSRPAELAVAGRAGPRLLTDLNGDALDHKTLAAVESVHFPSSLDGRQIQAWVARPPGYEPGRRYPLILEIHGGPYAAYGPHFAPEVQLYAAAGYLVLYVNPRGSTSYGDEFANLIQHAYPGGDFDDLMSAVDYAIDAGWADPERLYVTGGSGGGILSAWIVTHSDRFRAAVAQKPVINWYSLAYTTDIYTIMFPYWFANPPWQDPMPYLNRSPLQFVDRATTPTMLITGENDFRTPISEAEQFYQALKLNGVDTALVRIPEASHGIASRPSHMISKILHVLAWFARYDHKAE